MGDITIMRAVSKIGINYKELSKDNTLYYVSSNDYFRAFYIKKEAVKAYKKLTLSHL